MTKIINKMEFGPRAIHDILGWNDVEQVRQQGPIGKSLVKQFMDHYMPQATASNWSDVPGAVALVVQNIHNLFWRPPRNPPRFLANIDVNTPNSRDSLKITEISNAVANVFKNFGVERCALLAHMATYPK